MITNQTRKKFAELSELLADPDAATGRWLILTHDNPDPDSVAAAAGLAALLRRTFRRKVTVAYGGMIGRAENQEMVRVLGIRLSHLRHLTWKNYRHFALVDTQPGTGNNQLAEGVVPDLVFDHHPVRKASHKATFLDIRTNYGATATILAEYLWAADVEVSRSLATALVYAIRSETQDFGREYAKPDRAVYDELHPVADIRALARIQSPRLPLTYFGNLHEALENIESVDSLVLSHLGHVEQPDIVPEIADLLLRLQGKTWSLATGLFNDRVYVSIRTTNPRADAGRLMRRLLGRRGKGGGHGMMAGGWIPSTDPSDGPIPTAQQRLLASNLARQLRKKPERILKLDLSRQTTSAG